MRHHKYACGFSPCRGVYDSGVTVFALSEVIYLSSSVTAGTNKAEDIRTSHPSDRLILKASEWRWDQMKLSFANLIFGFNIQ